MTKKPTRRDPYAAFLRALRQTPRTWMLTKSDRLRQDTAYLECPLEAVSSHGLRRRGLRRAVVAAADRSEGHDPRLRARLLRACGVTERGR